MNFQNKKRKREENDSDDSSPPPAKKTCKLPHKEETKSLYASQGAIVRLDAKISEQETVILFDNPRVNSVFGHFPIAHEYVKEDKSTATKKGAELIAEVAALSEIEVPNSTIKIKPCGFPTLTDGMCICIL